jgi:hypothetical protein
MNRALHRCSVCVAAWLLAGLPSAAAAQVVVDLSQPQPTSQTVQVAGAGQAVPVAILRNATPPRGALVRLAVMPFLSDTGETLVPLLAVDPAAKGEQELEIKLGAPQLTRVYLLVPAPPGPGPYSGHIFVFGDATVVQGGRLQKPVSIAGSNPSRPASLQLMPDGDRRMVTINPLSFKAYDPKAVYDKSLGPTVEFRLADAAGRWDVMVDVGAATITKAPGNLNFSDQAAFYGPNGNRLDERPFRIPAAGQTIKMQVGGLSAGEYNVAIPFIATNGTSEPRKFALVVAARHHIAFAFLTLIVALLLSYAGQKAISIRAERVKLLNRIAELRPFWLQSEPPTMAVVWVQSMVAQANKLSKRRLLPDLETIHKRLDTAAALLQAIDRLRRVRVEIRQTVLPRFASARAFKLAERIGDRLDPEMGAAELTEIATLITELRGWTRHGEWQPRYVADLSASIRQLLAVVDPPAITNPDHREKIAALFKVLKSDMPKEGPLFEAQLEERERVYAALKIAWERKDADEFPEILDVLDKGIDQIFKKADDTAWARLKNQRALARFELISHRGGQQAEAFDPLIVRFTSGSQALDRTFLVMHNLQYEWGFTIDDGTRKAELKPMTRGPHVPLFSPFAGTLKPSLALFYSENGERLSITPLAEVTVTASSRFAALRSVSFGEVVQLFLAFLLAAISGLTQFYYKNEGFGALADYMGLFAWGATIDQIKNYLTMKPAPAAPVVPVPPVPPTPVVPVPTKPPAGNGEGGGAAGGQKPVAPNEGGPPNAGGGQQQPKPPMPDIPKPQSPKFLPLGKLKIKKPEE